MALEYQVGDALQIKGTMYCIIGKVWMKNTENESEWYEYRMLSTYARKEMWLSVYGDEDEYTLCQLSTGFDMTNYNLVAESKCRVEKYWGNVDVERGNCGSYRRYEDVVQEQLIFYETWKGRELSFFGGFITTEDIVFKASEMTIQGMEQDRKLFMKTKSINTWKSMAVIEALMLGLCFLTAPSGDNSGESELHAQAWDGLETKALNHFWNEFKQKLKNFFFGK